MVCFTTSCCTIGKCDAYFSKKTTHRYEIRHFQFEYNTGKCNDKIAGCLSNQVNFHTTFTFFVFYE